MTTKFTDRVETFLARPELQRVFDEARRLAKDTAAKSRIDDARQRLVPQDDDRERRGAPRTR